jgi:hypothetical protein
MSAFRGRADIRLGSPEQKSRQLRRGPERSGALYHQRDAVEREHPFPPLSHSGLASIFTAFLLNGDAASCHDLTIALAWHSSRRGWIMSDANCYSGGA